MRLREVQQPTRADSVMTEMGLVSCLTPNPVLLQGFWQKCQNWPGWGSHLRGTESQRQALGNGGLG